MEDPYWHLVCVRPRFEGCVLKQLEADSVENFYPIYRPQRASRTIDLPLFPTYIFCKFPRDRRASVFSTPGVLAIADCEHRVLNQDVECLSRILNSGLSYGPGSHIESGISAVVTEGPLTGLKGFLPSDNCFIVPVKSIFRSVVVELGSLCRVVVAGSDFGSHTAA